MINGSRLAFSMLSLLPLWVLQPHSHIQHRQVDTQPLEPYDSSGKLTVPTYSQFNEDKMLFELYFYRVRAPACCTSLAWLDVRVQHRVRCVCVCRSASAHAIRVQIIRSHTFANHT